MEYKMRNISVETDTYAAIWADRQPGEENEDAIIRRKFGIKAVSTQAVPQAKIGWSDLRTGVAVSEGFEIFRTYKGTEYRATASNGAWVLKNTGATYPSLNQLSRAVSGNVENAWYNWYFKNALGARELVTALRRPQVNRR
jgi:hypothetical protein